MPKISEHDLQRAFCIWLDGNPHPQTGVPRAKVMLAPGVVYWHTPNGGTRRDGFEAKRLKEIGVKAGIHDLLFLARGQLFGMEWKAPGGVLSPAQLVMHPRLHAAGMADSIVVDDLADARLFCRQHLLTV